MDEEPKGQVIDNLREIAGDEILYSERKVEEAKKLIAKYLPVGLPQQPTRLCTEFVQDDGDEQTSGQYLGAVRGVNYIRLDIPEKNYFSRGLHLQARPRVKISAGQDEVNLAVVTHELIHQKIAEVIGQESYFGGNLNELVTDDEVRVLDPKELFFRIHQKRIETDMIVPNSLIKAIDEGIATSAELFIMNQRINELKVSHDERLAALLGEKKLRIKFLIMQRWGNYSHYTAGARIVARLVRKVGLEQLPGILTSIDIDKCKQIMKGSEEYEAILKNPFLIPGLKLYS